MTENISSAEWKRRRYTGILGEMAVQDDLTTQGCPFVKMTRYDQTTNTTVFDEEVVDTFLKRNGYRWRKRRKIVKIIGSWQAGYPDFLCLKDGQIGFVEAKSNEAYPTKSQRITFELIRKLGYPLWIYRVPIKFSTGDLLRQAYEPLPSST